MCWITLKRCYEDDSGPKHIYLIDKKFNLRKIKNISMDANLTERKNVVDKMEKVNVGLLEDVVVYYTIKNLLKEYDVFCEV